MEVLLILVATYLFFRAQSSSAGNTAATAPTGPIATNPPSVNISVGSPPGVGPVQSQIPSAPAPGSSCPGGIYDSSGTCRPLLVTTPVVPLPGSISPVYGLNPIIRPVYQTL